MTSEILPQDAREDLLVIDEGIGRKVAQEYYSALGADGSLYFVSDRDGASRLHKAPRRADGGFDAPAPFGPPTVGLDAGDTALARTGAT